MYYNLSEYSLEDLQEMRFEYREEQREIDKVLYGNKEQNYKTLQKLADRRYTVTERLLDIEDEIIHKRRKRLNMASALIDSGAIYTDASSKGLSNRSGRNAKICLHGVSI